MQIRQANSHDAERVSALARQTYVAAFGHSFSPADLAAHLENHLSPTQVVGMLAMDVFLVAELESRMVGFVQFGPGSLDIEGVAGEGDQELRRLYVLAEFQNKGIGAMLMSAALEHPNLKRAERVYLDVWEHNLGAQRFYARHGFEGIHKRQFVHASGELGDFDLIMVKGR